MAWRRPGDKPLSEPMLVSLLTHICVIWPQWLKSPFVCIERYFALCNPHDEGNKSHGIIFTDTAYSRMCLFTDFLTNGNLFRLTDSCWILLLSWVANASFLHDKACIKGITYYHFILYFPRYINMDHFLSNCSLSLADAAIYQGCSICAIIIRWCLLQPTHGVSHAITSTFGFHQLLTGVSPSSQQPHSFATRCWNVTYTRS